MNQVNVEIYIYTALRYVQALIFTPSAFSVLFQQLSENIHVDSKHYVLRRVKSFLFTKYILAP